MNDQSPPVSRRQALALAAALTLAVGTAAAAVGGIARTTPPRAHAVSALVAPAAPPAAPAQEVDD
jgi:hypothetical protein